MARQSSIKRLPTEVRSYLERLLREDRYTLDELIQRLQSKFPGENTPSRSSLHRYRTNMEEMLGRMREIDAAANVLVKEFGEDAGDKAGALLAQSITTLATNAAFKAHSEMDDISIEEIGKLARAAKAAMETRTMSFKERQAIERAAEERLLKEQNKKLEDMGRKGTLSQETLASIRRDIYGIVS